MHFTTKKLWYFSLGALVLVALFWQLAGSGGEEAATYETVLVDRGSVLSMVSVTGHVEPTDRVQLAFPSGGRIAALLVREGDRIVSGDVVATLDTAGASSALAEAQARVTRERAVFEELVAPLRSEESALEQARVAEARIALDHAERSAQTTLARAYTLVQDAITEEVDELFTGGPAEPRFGIRFEYDSTNYFITADAATASEINSSRARVTDILTALAGRTAVDPAVIESELAQTAQDLKAVDDFLTLLATAVNRYRPDDTANQSVYDSFQTSIASARTSISTARNEVDAASASYASAYTAYGRASRTLQLAYAGASDETLRTQQATIDVAMRAVDTARTRVQDSVLTSPIQGIVGRVSVDVGETVSSFTPVIEVLGEGVFEVETYIPEADIALVELGDPALVTFDAYGDAEPLVGEVVRIALSETVREGVPTYKTTIMFTGPVPNDMFLRPGMTADVDISTDSRDDVLFVPTRCIQRDGARTYVRVIREGVSVQQDVVTGLRGSEGTVEVLSGLAQGDEVVLYME